MIFRQIYDTLVYRDSATHEFLPGLATSWDVSTDGLTYTFHLRQDIKFHGGSQFDAHAVGRNIDRIFKPELPASRARLLIGPLSQYEIPNDFTIRLHLFTPYAAFLDGWAQPHLGIASPQALQAYGDLRYQFYQDGTGPFQLVEYLPGERIALQRFENYGVRPAIYRPLLGDEIERAVFSISTAGTGDALTLLSDSLDVIDDMTPVEARNLSANSRVRILPTSIPGQTVQLLLNSNRPHLNRRDVREALLLATNRAAISNQIFLNFSSIAWAPLSESTGFSHTGYVNQYVFDQAAAQNLLLAAGYRDTDDDGIREYQGTALVLRIVVPPWGLLQQIAEFLRDEWRAIGINLILETVPGRSRFESYIQSGEYDLLPIDNYGIDPDLLSRVFLGNSGYFASQAPNSRLTDLLLAAVQENDPAFRRNQYYEIQALLMNDVFVLPVRNYVRLTASKSQVQELRFDAYGFYPLLFNARIESG